MKTKPIKCKVLVKTSGNPYPHRGAPTEKGDLVCCRWTVLKDGYCRKHHPETVRAVLIRRRARLEGQLSEIEKRLKAIELI